MGFLESLWMPSTKAVVGLKKSHFSIPFLALNLNFLAIPPFFVDFRVVFVDLGGALHTSASCKNKETLDVMHPLIHY